MATRDILPVRSWTVSHDSVYDAAAMQNGGQQQVVAAGIEF